MMAPPSMLEPNNNNSNENSKKEHVTMEFNEVTMAGENPEESSVSLIKSPSRLPASPGANADAKTGGNSSDNSCVQVAVRVRPFLPQEAGNDRCVDVLKNSNSSSNDRTNVIRMGEGATFVFDEAFAPTVSQSQLFDVSILPLVMASLKGYNATVLAYGQTGSGKTYTILGPSHAVMEEDDNDHAGIIPRALRELFRQLELTRLSNEEENQFEYEVRVQFLELYGEEIRDLLNSSSSHKLTIRDGANSGVEPEVIGASEVKVSSAEEALLCLTRGSLRRVTGATAMNAESSRSHAIMTVVIEQSTSLGGEEGEQETKRSKFHFVDLAGSERQKRSLAEGKRLKEGIDINKGLLVLGNVISALGDPKKRGKTFVPYRDSKLTRLLKGSLGGNHKTLMIACVSPSSSNMEESLNCLRYANRAKNIQNNAIVNQDPGSKLISQLKQQIQSLASELLKHPLLPESIYTIELLNTLAQGKNENVPITKQQQQLSIKSAPSEDSQRNDSRRSLLTRTVGIIEAEKAQLQRLQGQNNQSQEFDESTDNHFEEIQQKYLKLSSRNLVGGLDDDDDAQNEDMDQSHSVDSTGDDENQEEDHHDEMLARRQKEMDAHISSLSKSIETKEDLINQLRKSTERYDSMRTFYEGKLHDMEDQLRQRESERLLLKEELDKHEKDSLRSRELQAELKQKEQHIESLRRKQKDLSNLTQYSASNQNVINRLKEDVSLMKRQKADLQRQIVQERKMHATTVRELRKQATKRDREVFKSKGELRKQEIKAENAQRISKKHIEEANKLRTKYREAEKRMRMQTLKRGVMEKVGLDPIMVGRRSKTKRSGSQCLEDAKLAYTSRRQRGRKSGAMNYENADAIREFFNGKVAEIGRKEESVDKLAHEWEDHLELTQRKKDVIQKQQEAPENKKDIFNEEIEALNIQIQYKQGRIRQLTQRLKNNKSSRVESDPKDHPLANSAVRVFDDEEYDELCDGLSPLTSAQVSNKILFGMVVKERRRVAALAKTASILDQKALEFEELASSKDAAMRSFMDEQRNERTAMAQNQQDQILSLMALVQEEELQQNYRSRSPANQNMSSPNAGTSLSGFARSKTPRKLGEADENYEIKTPEKETNIEEQFTPPKEDIYVPRPHSSQTLVLRLANERISALEQHLLELQGEKEAKDIYKEREAEAKQALKEKNAECEQLKAKLRKLSVGINKVREKVKTAKSYNHEKEEKSPQNDSKTFQIIDAIVSDALENTPSKGKRFDTQKQTNKQTISFSESHYFHTSDSEGDDDTIQQEWEGDIMADLEIIATGRVPPSLAMSRSNSAQRSRSLSARRKQSNNAEAAQNVFERLTNPGNFTGVQKNAYLMKEKQKHNRVNSSYHDMDDDNASQSSVHNGDSLRFPPAHPPKVRSSSDSVNSQNTSIDSRRSVFERLQSISNYTGTQKKAHLNNSSNTENVLRTTGSFTSTE